MFFSKFPHPRNFSFVGVRTNGLGPAEAGKHHLDIQAQSYVGGIHHISIRAENHWPSNRCLAPLDIPNQTELGVTITDGRIEISDESGEIVLRGSEGGSFGVSARQSMFSFEMPEGASFFGMGEKNFGELELSGRRVLFWNTDVWSDFHHAHWLDSPTDPSYCSVPYVAVRLKKGYAGLLLHNPSPTFIETPGWDEDRAFIHWQKTSPTLILGAYDGEPNLWVITAPTLAELTVKLQNLVGKTPTPPMWSLGYQQSRWGYGGHDDLVKLDEEFTKHKIPCSGLWLDLDYMDGYRIFQVDKSMFPHGVKHTANLMKKSKRRIVPIIDPGVKSEVGYRIYDDGITHKVFCQNPEGRPYIGIVWPGETVYPDFTQEAVREWWAGYACEFRSSGFGACWVDMNDPSTGPAEPDSMLFEQGQRTHAEHRNQYALGMQMATRDGFLHAAPNERPFILSRSGFTGSSRYSAIWTGDNYANDMHLKLALTTVLGMSLSGLPFAGADVGGFGGDTDDDMIIRWTQLAFLSPFMRNHTNKGATNQEPWAYKPSTRQIVGHYIRLRYQFLPYIYSLFAAQEKNGEPMTRPLLYDFDEPAYDNVGDQAMVGPFLLHAPLVKSKAKVRTVVLPGDKPWFDLTSGDWVDPGIHEVSVAKEATPVYARAGALIPVQANLPTGNDVDLHHPLVLVAIPDGWKGESSFEYVADDGLTFEYQRGKRTRVLFTARRDKGSLALGYEVLEDGGGEVVPKFALFQNAAEVTVNGKVARKSSSTVTLTGRELPVVALGG